MDEQTLIHSLKNPEARKEAFEWLMHNYQRKVYSIVRKMVIDHEDADDITQEVFIRIWKSLDNFRGDAKLFTWIYKITTNLCLNFLQKKKKKFWLSIQNISKDLTQKLESSPYVEANEVQLKLQKALLKLPDKQRLVFNMKYYEDLKYEEISEILGTSIGALKASYHLAVKKIEESLQTD
ncbi:MAG: RNA polymerase sigma factor [Cytophagales bacterium]|nr:MAG: RNA polymerase sigma factor [Cytophagales bacterium]